MRNRERREDKRHGDYKSSCGHNLGEKLKGLIRTMTKEILVDLKATKQVKFKA